MHQIRAHHGEHMWHIMDDHAADMTVCGRRLPTSQGSPGHDAVTRYCEPCLESIGQAMASADRSGRAPTAD